MRGDNKCKEHHPAVNATPNGDLSKIACMTEKVKEKKVCIISLAGVTRIYGAMDKAGDRKFIHYFPTQCGPQLSGSYLLFKSCSL